MEVIKVDADKCVLCNRCIACCPEQFASIYSDGQLAIDDEMCIGCGACVEACSHGARSFIDDTDKAFIDIKSGVKTIVFLAPAVAGYYDMNKLSSFFKSQGVSKVYDVSFGAELTTESYLQFIKRNNLDLLIAQPCPVVVDYIEKNTPNLLPYLAPVHSPMMHTIEWVQKHHPRFKDYQIIVVSPCIAKKHEFLECGQDVHLVTLANLESYLTANSININSHKPRSLDTLESELGATYPVPGGLKASIQRTAPHLAKQVKTLEGPDRIFEMLDELNGMNPKEIPFTVLDILHCKQGCAVGSAVPTGKHPEFRILKENPLLV